MRRYEIKKIRFSAVVGANKEIAGLEWHGFLKLRPYPAIVSQPYSRQNSTHYYFDIFKSV
jgi:hypothetical protein